jgi:hypothetical protein
MTCQQKK